MRCSNRVAACLLALTYVSCEQGQLEYPLVFVGEGDKSDTLLLTTENYYRISKRDTIAFGEYSLDEDVANFYNYIEPGLLPSKGGKGSSVMFYLSRNNISGFPDRIIVSQDHGISFRRLR